MKIYRRPIAVDFSDRNFLLTVAGSATNAVFFHIGVEHTSATNAIADRKRLKGLAHRHRAHG